MRPRGTRGTDRGAGSADAAEGPGRSAVADRAEAARGAAATTRRTATADMTLDETRGETRRRRAKRAARGASRCAPRAERAEPVKRRPATHSTRVTPRGQSGLAWRTTRRTTSRVSPRPARTHPPFTAPVSACYASHGVFATGPSPTHLPPLLSPRSSPLSPPCPSPAHPPAPQPLGCSCRTAHPPPARTPSRPPPA